MQSEERLTPAERELEMALAMLAPVATIDRDRMMFRAGQASMRGRQRLWHGTTAALAVALVASVGIRMIPQPPAGQHFAANPVRSTEPGQLVSDLGTGDKNELEYRAEYLSLRDRVLIGGVDVLPAPSGSASASESPIRIERLVPARPAPKRGFFGIEKWIDLGAQS